MLVTVSGYGGYRRDACHRNIPRQPENLRWNVHPNLLGDRAFPAHVIWLPDPRLAIPTGARMPGRIPDNTLLLVRAY